MNIIRITQPGRLRLIIAAVIVAIAGLIIPLSQIASARTAEAAAAGDGPKPSIVLVHGAWADSGSWNRVTHRLQADGYTVYALPNPLRGLPYEATGSRLPALLTNARCVVIAGGSHAIIWTHADEVNQALLDFIGHLGRPADRAPGREVQ